jgi:hypothetical protein
MNPAPGIVEMPDAVSFVEPQAYAGDHGDIASDDESSTDERHPNAGDGAGPMDVDDEDIPAPRGTLQTFFGVKPKTNAKPSTAAKPGKR